MMGDGKYEGIDPRTRLHSGEPYFFLRAQDRLAPSAVENYADRLQSVGLTRAAVEVLRFAERMREWQEANPSLVKLPD